MPVWSEVLSEIRELQESGVENPFDDVRRKYLQLLHEHSGRNVLLYATAFTQSKVSPPGSLQVVEEDIQGLMEVVHGIAKEPTDVVIHSPGGSPEAAEGIVEYLHTQYPHIRAIVPQTAMSAATMIVCGMNEVLMGKHSNLGPIDPQLYIPSSKNYEPAQAILDQFEMAVRTAAKPGMQAWAAMLQMYGPSLVVQCTDLLALSEEMVTDWLSRWMFEGDRDGKRKATRIAQFLADRKNFRSHNRHVRREQARNLGLKVRNLEDDETLQDLVLSVFHATTHTFAGTNAVKIIENHTGKAFIKLSSMIPVQMPTSPEPS